MADYFTTTSFALHAHASEAAILPEIDDVIDALQDGFSSADVAMAAWLETSDRFRQLFPADDPAKPFAQFTALFDDETFPCHGAEIDFRADPECETGGIVEVSGDQVDPVAVARLLRKILPSALPFQFGWAETCSLDELARGESFGGGFMEVTADRLIPLHGLGQNVDRQRMVIVVRDQDCGLLFWNNVTGFGPLKTATVFSPREAEEFRLPGVDGGPPGWLELPPLASLLGDVA